jgi:hypothetical protein
LAVGTIKRRPLGLHDANDQGAAALDAGLASAVIDTVVVLIAAGLIEGVAVRAVGQCGAFVLDGEVQDFEHAGVNVGPLVGFEQVATLGGMDAG